LGASDLVGGFKGVRALCDLGIEPALGAAALLIAYSLLNSRAVA
jgi:hypothetical protein